jgi:hypothetical protein
LGGIVSNYKPGELSMDDIDSGNVNLVDVDFDTGEGCGSIIASILLWILTALFLSFIIWLFTNVVIMLVLAFIAMLHWIFFRAIRLVFKNSNKSKGDLTTSI